jgi:signal transduction histidine kinase/DNA-binding response OmpR family regulator
MLALQHARPENALLAAYILACIAALCVAAAFTFWISLRQRAKHLAEPLSTLQQLLNALPEGVLHADATGKISFTNRTAIQMLSIADDPAATQYSLHDLLHPPVLRCGAACQLRIAIAEERNFHGIETLQLRDGKSLTVEIMVTPAPGGVAVTLRDVTEQQEIEHLKDEFVSTVSHELRTPLTSIRGALGLLSAGLLGELSDKATNLLRIAVNNTDRLVRLINDLLDLERMASGRAPLYLRRSELKDVIERAVETMTPMADAVKIKITANTEAVPLAMDPDRMEQVLTNLLSNAIKFSQPDTVIEITQRAITQRIEGDTLHLTVTDHGRGIPEDKLETIFERFQQIDAADARQKGGSGLGLTICRHIIQQHGGRIWATRNPAGGSMFHITLPQDLAISATVPSPAGDGTVQLRSGATVLICDDDETLRHIVHSHLRLHGYNILEAGSGEQAIVIANGTPVDVILLDLYMPGISGWETLQRLRKNPATAQIPVVILSILSPSEQPRVAGNAAGWVQKPYNDNLLLNELSRVLRTSEGPARILLVEDDTDLAQVLASSFEGTGIVIDHAATRTAAMRYFEQHRPEILILDLTLPDGDGFGLVDWMRQKVELRTLPLVVYSGHEVSRTERDQLVLGPTEFLTKAKVQPQDLEELVLTMLRQFHGPNTSDPISSDASVSRNANSAAKQSITRNTGPAAHL